MEMNTCDIFSAMKQDTRWDVGGEAPGKNPYFKELNSSNPA